MTREPFPYVGYVDCRIGRVFENGICSVVVLDYQGIEISGLFPKDYVYCFGKGKDGNLYGALEVTIVDGIGDFSRAVFEPRSEFFGFNWKDWIGVNVHNLVADETMIENLVSILYFCRHEHRLPHQRLEAHLVLPRHLECRPFFPKLFEIPFCILGPAEC